MTGTSRFLALLTAGLLVVLSPVGTLAQTTTATCLSSYAWMSNSKSQTPCLVGAFLQGACNGGQFTVDALPNNTHYTGPYADQQNDCQCSTVTYNVISACGICQGDTYISWTAWATNCSVVYPGVFPQGIPEGTAVPQWAFQDVTQSDLFNATLAQQVGDSPESTATSVQSTATVVASTTSTSVSAALTSTPSASSSSTPSTDNTNSGNSSKTGSIAGGVIGGVVGVALIAGAVIFFLRRKRSGVALSTRHAVGLPSPPPSGFTDTSPFAAQMAQPRLYDPSDPSTFPITPPPVLSTTGSSGVISPTYPSASYSSHSVPQGGNYSGVPEI